MTKTILPIALLVAFAASGSALADSRMPAAPSADEAPLSSPYYPRACLDYPLPDTPVGIVDRHDFKLLVTNGIQETYEDAEIIVWRQPCSPAYSAQDGWQPRGALLLRIERADVPTANSRAVTPFPSRKTGGAFVPLRLAAEPNTLFGDNAAYFMSTDTTYVLEEFRQPPSLTDMNGKLDLVITDVRNRHMVELTVAAFEPTAEHYPELFEPTPITGLLNGIFMDPAHSGEGLNVQVLRFGDTRIVDVAWFTYGANGNPFWIGGAEAIDAGDNSVTITMFRTAGGGFAGDFGADVERTEWGTLSLHFDNCNQVTFDYAANDDLADGVPAGSGTRTWQRLANIDQLPCS